MYRAFPTQCHRGSLFQIGLVVSSSYCQHLFKYTSFRVIWVFEIMKDLQLLYYPPRIHTYTWAMYTPRGRNVLANYEGKIIDSYSTICEYFLPRHIPLINRICLIKCDFWRLVFHVGLVTGCESIWKSFPYTWHGTHNPKLFISPLFGSKSST